MTTNVSPAVKPNDQSTLWTGVLLILFGLAGIVLPLISTLVTETWIALILISAGGAKLYYGFKTRHEGGFVWKLLLGALYIATGVMLFIYPRTGVLTLTLLLGGFLLTEGVFNLILAFRLRPQQNWTWVLGDAVITLLLGGFIWFQWPFDAPWLLGTLVGASVLSSGISRIMLALRSRTQVSSPDQAASV